MEGQRSCNCCTSSVPTSHVARHTSHVTLWQHITSCPVMYTASSLHKNATFKLTRQKSHVTRQRSETIDAVRLTSAATSAGVPIRFIGMRCTEHASHTSHVTHHASNVTHHASNVTHHASNVTHHASNVTCNACCCCCGVSSCTMPPSI